MDKFINLYDFIDLAKSNRKYPENTANNLKSALKIFEKDLNSDELSSIQMIEDSVEEIFRSVVKTNKHKSILSLNTYKARLLKVISDYKKYGADPAKIHKWIPRLRQGSNKQEKKSTPLLIKKDKTDKKKINLSNFIYDSVENNHKIELSSDFGKITIIIPKKITQKDTKLIKNILDSMAQ